MIVGSTIFTNRSNLGSAEAELLLSEPGSVRSTAFAVLPRTGTKGAFSAAWQGAGSPYVLTT
jgi:hypothetical protein